MTKPVKQMIALAAVTERLGLAGTISSTLRVLPVRSPERWRIPSPEDTRHAAGTLTSVHD
jgi:hypothetical protein